MGLARSQDTRSTHKNQLHFYSLITTTQKTKFKNTMSFKISSKKMKCLGINLTKQIQNLYGENYKMLMKEIKEGLHKRREILFMDWKTQHSNDVNPP